jgi:hypothetical protein
MRKMMSAVFSYFSAFVLDRIEIYDKILETRKRIIAIPTNSSIIVSIPNFEILIKLSMTKHRPNKFADVGNICLDIFFFSLKLSDIEIPPDNFLL